MKFGAVFLWLFIVVMNMAVLVYDIQKNASSDIIIKDINIMWLGFFCLYFVYRCKTLQGKISLMNDKLYRSQMDLLDAKVDAYCNLKKE